MVAGVVVFGGGWIAVVGVLTRGCAYGVFKPAADRLYTRVGAEARYKTKNFIDTSVWRFGDLIVTSGFNLLRTIGATVPVFAALSMIAAASSGWMGWRITKTPELASDSALPERT
jgi:AAA family ATP:ADP antiporter